MFFYQNELSAQDVCMKFQDEAFNACQLGLSSKAIGYVCNEYYEDSNELLEACDYGFYY